MLKIGSMAMVLRKLAKPGLTLHLEFCESIGKES
jgi:hypothetical protein